jgi:hypothetical protein
MAMRTSFSGRGRLFSSGAETRSRRLTVCEGAKRVFWPAQPPPWRRRGDRWCSSQRAAGDRASVRIDGEQTSTAPTPGAARRWRGMPDPHYPGGRRSIATGRRWRGARAISSHTAMTDGILNGPGDASRVVAPETTGVFSRSLAPSDGTGPAAKLARIVEAAGVSRYGVGIIETRLGATDDAPLCAPPPSLVPGGRVVRPAAVRRRSRRPSRCATRTWQGWRPRRPRPRRDGETRSAARPAPRPAARGPCPWRALGPAVRFRAEHR